MGHLRFTLNGTDKNPWHYWGLTQNPFPQLGTAATDAACLALQSLGGDPIPDAQYIRDKLQGYFTQEFIDEAVKRYVPGKEVDCIVGWEDGT
jgi:hypothetical protein